MKVIKVKHSHQLMIYIALTFILAIVIWNSKSNSNELPKKKYINNVDTHIPYGYNLHPIEVQNVDSLDALVGDFTLVNLYQTFKNKKNKLILQKIKLIRSPKNPRIFAALINNKNSQILSEYTGPFHVSIQNPNKPNQLFINKPILKKRTIILEDK